MRVLHVAASMSGHWGGPATSISGLVDGLAKHNVSSTIYAASGPRVGSEPISTGATEVRLFKTGLLSPVWTAHAPGMLSAIRTALADYDLLHVHELWHYPAYAASEAAVDARKPYVVSIHGGLGDWALSHKSMKKRVYMALAQRRILNGAAVLHAFTDTEAQQIRSQGFSGNVEVIPNGIDSERISALPDPEILTSRFPEMRGKRIVLFLGRLHPIKGLDIVADAFPSVLNRIPNAHLVIAGPDEDGYAERIKERICDLGVAEWTTFTGMLQGADQQAALAAADVFVLPSRSEGFSMTALEALATGVPVILSNQCNFPQVAEAGAGIVTDSTPEALADGIASILSDPALATAMGTIGRELTATIYSSETMARRMVTLYHDACAAADGEPSRLEKVETPV